MKLWVIFIHVVPWFFEHCVSLVVHCGSRAFVLGFIPSAWYRCWSDGMWRGSFYASCEPVCEQAFGKLNFRLDVLSAWRCWIGQSLSPAKMLKGTLKATPIASYSFIHKFQSLLQFERKHIECNSYKLRNYHILFDENCMNFSGLSNLFRDIMMLLKNLL